MVVSNPIWPTLEGLDAHWSSTIGAGAEVAKARWIGAQASRRMPARSRILIIGPASDVVLNAIEALNPAVVMQAYPPILGARQGRVPALLMDTDLPAFANATFDLVVLSFVLEFRSTPLALMSLAYEIMRPQGYLMSLVPHRFAPVAARPGYGSAYLGPDLTHQLGQAAFTPVQTKTLWSGGLRPLCVASLATPQYPPRPVKGFPIAARFASFLNQKRVGAVAARREMGIEAP